MKKKNWILIILVIIFIFFAGVVNGKFCFLFPNRTISNSYSQSDHIMPDKIHEKGNNKELSDGIEESENPERKCLGSVETFSKETVMHIIEQIQSSAYVYQTVSSEQIRNKGKVRVENDRIFVGEIPFEDDCSCEYSFDYGTVLDMRVYCRNTKTEKFISCCVFRDSELVNFTGTIKSIMSEINLFCNKSGKPVALWIRDPVDASKRTVIQFDKSGDIESQKMYQTDILKRLILPN